MNDEQHIANRDHWSFPIRQQTWINVFKETVTVFTVIFTLNIIKHFNFLIRHLLCEFLLKFFYGSIFKSKTPTANSFERIFFFELIRLPVFEIFQKIQLQSSKQRIVLTLEDRQLKKKVSRILRIYKFHYTPYVYRTYLLRSFVVKG